MPDTVQSVTLNGRTGPPSIATDWIRALNDERIVQAKAGFLFKASFDRDRILLHVEPFIVDGERRYHYNMHLENEDAFTLIGTVDAQGVFTLVFKPEHPELDTAQKAAHRTVLRRFAAFLLDAGYTGAGTLDEVTQATLAELGFRPAPETLAELCPDRP